MSLPQLLNLGLSGVAFASADIGGFFADGGPELFARWMQLGALYPFARANSAKGCAPNEPWAWGEEVEQISRRLLDRLTLDIYSDDDGAAEGMLYEDDGISFAYEQGSCCRAVYQCRVDRTSGASVLLARREGAYVPAARPVEIRLHGAGAVRRSELPSDEGNWRVELEP